MTIILKNTDGEWPALHRAIGGEVVRVKVQKKDRALILNLSGLGTPDGIEFVIAEPWTFTSCLLSTSSAEDGISGSSLIGLEGASLSDVESDSKHLDLVFGSIRISL